MDAQFFRSAAMAWPLAKLDTDIPLDEQLYLMEANHIGGLYRRDTQFITLNDGFVAWRAADTRISQVHHF